MLRGGLARVVSAKRLLEASLDATRPSTALAGSRRDFHQRGLVQSALCHIHCCSNATLLEETVGSSIDGMAVTAAGEFPKSFAISAAQDPGALPAGVRSPAC